MVPPAPPETHRIRQRNLPLLLLKAREQVMAHFRPILNHFGVTEQQWRVIRALDEAGELEPWQISEAAQIVGPSLTGVLARMEEMGLVERRRSTADQRRLLVRQTPAATALVAEMAPLVEAQYRNLREGLDPVLVDQLFEALDRLLAAADRPVERVALPGAGTDTARRGRRGRLPAT